MELDAAIGFDTDLGAVGELALRAERLGFGALWTAETRHDPFLPLALVADRTSRIRFGTAVAIAFARSPAVTAQTAWDLAGRSAGRFILGLGTQVRAHVERRFAMPWSGHPAEQLRDYVGAVRAIWHAWQTGEPIHHRGPYYRVSLMTPFFSPPPIEHPEIPIFLAAVGARMCRLAGEIGDGLVVHPLHSPRYLAEVLVPAVEEGAKLAGRSRRDLELSASVMVALDAEGREQVRQQVAFYASTPTYRPLLALHGWEQVGAALSERARRGRWSEMPALVSDELIDAFAVTGSWGELGERLRSRYEGLLDRIALYRPYGAPEDEAGWRRLVEGLRAAGP